MFVYKEEACEEVTSWKRNDILPYSRDADDEPFTARNAFRCVQTIYYLLVTVKSIRFKIGKQATFIGFLASV